MLNLRKELEASMRQRRRALELERDKILARLDELDAMQQEALQVVDDVERVNARPTATETSEEDGK